MHASSFTHVPELESLASSEIDRKIMTLSLPSGLLSQPFVLPPSTPNDQVEIIQEAFRKTYKDAEFHKKCKKLTADDPTPLMPNAHGRVIKQILRESEVIEICPKLVGADPLPPR
jgi:hypothetical protein